MNTWVLSSNATMSIATYLKISVTVLLPRYRSSPAGTEYAVALANACRGRISVAPPMNGEIGSWLWISDTGPPLVAMLSPPSNRTWAADRGFTGTLQVTWVPVVQEPVPVARFELSVIGIPVVIRSPAQPPTVQ